MATLPAMVAGSVSNMTLHKHTLSQRNASLHQPLAPPTAGVEHMLPSIEFNCLRAGPSVAKGVTCTLSDAFA